MMMPPDEDISSIHYGENGDRTVTYHQRQGQSKSEPSSAERWLACTHVLMAAIAGFVIGIFVMWGIAMISVGLWLDLHRAS